MDRTLPIELKFVGDTTGRRAQAASAWRIVGGPAEWLAELATWPVPHRNIQVLPLPSSSQNRQPNAALVLAPRIELEAAQWRPSAQCVAYQQPHDQLYIPADAQLWPPVTTSELNDLLLDRLHVWTPSQGLIAFGERPWLRVADLLDAAAPSRGAWRTAPMGEPLSPRIFALRGVVPPDADDALRDGQDDIGSRADRPEEMPRSEHESKPGAMGAAETHGKKLAAGAAKMASSVLPGSWAERLAQWADRQEEDINRTMEADRSSEVERLMKLMDDDPDEGLRFAPPLSNDSAPRGEAPASGKLSERDPDFSLGRLSASGPGQAWSVSGAHYYRLKAQYREAAARELQLNRHRRAAYIFAELLGDYQAAASALLAGGHFRDAAALYRQKLNDPERAANCLKKAGLLTDAIEIYLDLEQHEEAGDVYAQLDREDDARKQYRAAVEHLRAQPERNYMKTARLLAHKLSAPREALGELEQSWPDGAQAADCMDWWFRLAKELDVAAIDQRRQVDRVAWNTISPHDSLKVLVSAASVESEVQDYARSMAPRVVAEHLLETHPGERSRLVAALQRLSPSDRLLRRDSERFLRRVAERHELSRKRHAPNRPVLVRRVALPDAHWNAMCRVGERIVTARLHNGTVQLLPVLWGEDCDPSQISKPWNGESFGLMEGMDVSELTLLAASHDHVRHFFVVHPAGLEMLRPRSIRMDGKHQWVLAGGASGVTPATMSVAVAPTGVVWSLNYHGEQAVLDGYKDQAIASSRVLIEDPSLEPPEFMPQLCVDDRTCYVAWGRQVHAVCGDQAMVYNELPFEARRLACSRSHSLALVSSYRAKVHSQTRLAVGYEFGGSLIWHANDDFEIRPLAEDMADPEFCFTNSGYLIAAGRKQLEIYTTFNNQLELVAAMEQSDLEPTAICAGSRAKQFVVLNRGVELLFFEVP